MSILTPPTLQDGSRWQGLRIGLLGGSFNPPHVGHYHIAKIARARFGLDFVWWIVTPQNPLKDKKHMAPYDARFGKVEEMLKGDPYQMPTHLERDLGSQYTYQTVVSLKNAFPHTDFLWVCGMDNALIFHRWDSWRDLLQEIPMTFIARPPAGTLVRSCPVRLYDVPHHYQTAGRQTDLKSSGIYWLTGTKMIDISSSKIRKELSKNSSL